MNLKGTRADQAIALYNQANDFVTDAQIADALKIAGKNVACIRNTIVKRGYGFRVKNIYIPEISKHSLAFKIDRRGKGYRCVDPVKSPVSDSVFESILEKTNSLIVKEVVEVLRDINDSYWVMDDLIERMGQPANVVKYKFYCVVRHQPEHLEMHVRDDYINPRRYIVTAPYKRIKQCTRSKVDTPDLVIPIYLTPVFKTINNVFRPLEETT